MLVRAEFGADQINSGDRVEVTFSWKSKNATTVFLNFDTSMFSVDPMQFDLEAAATTRTRVEHVRIMKLSVNARFCDVHFVQGVSDAFDTMEVL